MNRLNVPDSDVRCWITADCTGNVVYSVQWKCSRCPSRGVALLCPTHTGHIVRRVILPMCRFCIDAPLIGAGIEGLN